MILLNGIGINQTDLLLLERHVVFSVSSKKAAACFFIIQCTKTVSEGIIPVPIKDVIDRYGSGNTFLYFVLFYLYYLLVFLGALRGYGVKYVISGFWRVD